MRGARYARAARTLGVVLATGLLVLGCSSPVAGRAVKDPNAAPPGEVQPELLEPGNYPTARRPEPRPSAQTAVLVEAHRIAGYVVGPWEVDPALIDPNPLATLVIASPKALDLVMPAPGSDIAAAHHLINGFATERHTADGAGPQRALGNAVMRFPTDGDAAAAAADFAAQLSPPPGTPPWTPVDVPGHPEALARQGALDDGMATVTSVTAHGPYVLYQYARAKNGVDAATALVAKTLDLQGGRIDAFTPTDPAQFATLDPDPTHLLAATLIPENPTVNMGLYDQAGILHFQGNPIQGAQLYTDAGLDAAAVGKTTIYQTKDAAAAVVLADKIAGIIGDGKQPGAPVPGMPKARCFIGTGTDMALGQFSCVAAAQRWVITAMSKQDFDARQQIAAQYLMLVGK